ncbi:hypothetical protein C5167_018631 [Papaver somniferum]|uniref:Non-haem dioxygenase N-terminal domain-containing protein n=1 Tax=Papaver somniferum TaxID=3469 RepID=A0A4Y7INE9_PAPSO|nr:hypothetical protein C5167_018631 [Papaver somniferum]
MSPSLQIILPPKQRNQTEFRAPPPSPIGNNRKSSTFILPQQNQTDFRAPPPSPIGNNDTNRKSTFVNENELNEFLERSLQVPDLILPINRVFPREILSTKKPPEIDYNSLTSSTQFDSEVLESISVIGCFQLLNHGISNDLIESVLNDSVGVFGISKEYKSILSRNSGKPYGFEEFSSGGNDEEMETSEEFAWCRDSRLNILMENLSTEIQKIAAKILRVLSESNTLIRRELAKENTNLTNKDGLFCCMYKHCKNINLDTGNARLCENSLKSDVIRMLVKGSDYSHALSVHVFDASSSDFNLYSKKGWVSFCPSRNALVVTIGDQIQAWSVGQYKHVIGRPLFTGKSESRVSMAFHYSPPTISAAEKFPSTEINSITLRQQCRLAIFFILFYHFIPSNFRLGIFFNLFYHFILSNFSLAVFFTLFYHFILGKF